MHHPNELIDFIESMPEPRILVDVNYRILAANSAYRQEYGQPKKLVGRTCYDVSHRFDRPCDQCGESCPLQTALNSSASSCWGGYHSSPAPTQVHTGVTP